MLYVPVAAVKVHAQDCLEVQDEYNVALKAIERIASKFFIGRFE
jgi:hypothetical protein